MSHSVNRPQCRFLDLADAQLAHSPREHFMVALYGLLWSVWNNSPFFFSFFCFPIFFCKGLFSTTGTNISRIRQPRAHCWQLSLTSQSWKLEWFFLNISQNNFLLMCITKDWLWLKRALNIYCDVTVTRREADLLPSLIFTLCQPSGLLLCSHLLPVCCQPAFCVQTESSLLLRHCPSLSSVSVGSNLKMPRHKRHGITAEQWWNGEQYLIYIYLWIMCWNRKQKSVGRQEMLEILTLHRTVNFHY